jgi:penicillin-binding protein 1A
MREALKDVPDAPLPMPAGLVAVKIDPGTGLKAGPGEEGVFEIFRATEVPRVVEVGEDGEPVGPAVLGGSDPGAARAAGRGAGAGAPLQDLF